MAAMIMRMTSMISCFQFIFIVLGMEGLTVSSSVGILHRAQSYKLFLKRTRNGEEAEG